MIFNLGDKKVSLEGEHIFIAPGADLIGDVTLYNEVSIWFQAVLRGDLAPIVIGERSNIQDGAVVHVDTGYPTTIGAGVTVGHSAVIHGCTIEDECLIGMNAVVLNGAKIGSGSLIGANALVPQGMIVPPRSLVLGSPGKIVKTLTEIQVTRIQKNSDHYVEALYKFLKELQEQK